ncbi:hypothetical protein BKA70DRAFT_1250660 [Coprinopsis sp. MPI-PUGE-AT-0042]|nr:hypothetical protein BKA70DRAFT_1250660 [Coprinopsis sp. MPI-PUGE-AT-0042]
MAPLFGFLKRKKNSAPEAPRKKKGKVKSQAQWRLTKILCRESFDPNLFVQTNPAQPWDVTNGGFRPVYASPTHQPSAKQAEAYDGPSPEDYAAWSSQDPGVSLNRYGSGQSSRLQPSFIPPISPEAPRFPPPRRRRRTRSGSTGSISYGASMDPPKRNLSPVPNADELSLISSPTSTVDDWPHRPPAQVITHEQPPPDATAHLPPPHEAPVYLSPTPHLDGPTRLPPGSEASAQLSSRSPTSTQFSSRSPTSTQFSPRSPSSIRLPPPSEHSVRLPPPSEASSRLPVPSIPDRASRQSSRRIPLVFNSSQAAPSVRAPTPPRTPSPTLSQKMRRRTVLGPMPAWTMPPPDSEDPLKRMEDNLQAASFLLNKLKGTHSDSSAIPPPSERPFRHRRAVSALAPSPTSRLTNSIHRIEVDPDNLVDPYIDRRKRGTEFHQIMNHGLLLHPGTRSGHVSTPRHAAMMGISAEGSREWTSEGFPSYGPPHDRSSGHDNGVRSPLEPTPSVQRQGVRLYDPPVASTSSAAPKVTAPKVTFTTLENKRKGGFPLFSSFRKRQPAAREQIAEEQEGLERGNSKSTNNGGERKWSLRRKRHESAPLSPPLRPGKITFAESEDSGNHSTKRMSTRDRSLKRHPPSELPLDQPPKTRLSLKALARSLSRSKSDRSDRKVRFKGGQDSVIPTPATQSGFKALPAPPERTATA